MNRLFSILVVLTTACYMHRLPPENYTSTSMYPLKRRILRFAKTHDRLPHAVSELPPLEGFINRTTDVWGNEIEFHVDGTTVRLVSYGKDKTPGGSGDNLDVYGIFEAKTADGKWADETSEEWTVKPLSDKY